MSNEVGSAFDRASHSYDKSAQVQLGIATGLADMLLEHFPNRRFVRAVDVGCGTGSLSRLLLERFEISSLTLNDISGAMLQEAAANLSGHAGITTLDCDAQKLLLDEKCDLIASASAVQWFSDPTSFVDIAAENIASGGVLLFSTFLPGTCREVRELTGIGLSYPDASAWTEKLSGKFRIIAIREMENVLEFSSPKAVLKHFSATGTTGAGKGFVWTRKTLGEFETNYRNRFSTATGSVTLTYRAILVMAVPV